MYRVNIYQSKSPCICQYIWPKTDSEYLPPGHEASGLAFVQASSDQGALLQGASGRGPCQGEASYQGVAYKEAVLALASFWAPGSWGAYPGRQKAVTLVKSFPPRNFRLMPNRELRNEATS